MTRTIPDIEDAQTLAQAIVDTIHEPLLVLDSGLRVLAASRAFYEIFRVDPEHTMGRLLYDLGDGQWNIPALRLLLETIIPEKTAMDGFEVEHDFPRRRPSRHAAERPQGDLRDQRRHHHFAGLSPMSPPGA
jgi:PAS domain-containing protein